MAVILKSCRREKRRKKKFIALQKSWIRAELWVWDWTWPQNALAKVTSNHGGREVSEVFIPPQVAVFIQSLGGSRLFHSAEVGHAPKRTHLHKHSHFQNVGLWYSCGIAWKWSSNTSDFFISKPWKFLQSGCEFEIFCCISPFSVYRVTWARCFHLSSFFPPLSHYECTQKRKMKTLK